MKKFVLSILVALASLAALPSIAYADGSIDGGGNVIIIGKRDPFRREFQEEYEQQMQALEEQYRGAYASRNQWNQLLPSTDTVEIASASTDTRCNGAAKNAAGGTTASSTLSSQKSSAESVVAYMKGAMTDAAFNSMVGGFPKQSGRTATDQSFTNTPILSIVWQDGTQTNFTMVQTGSGWSVGSVVNTAAKPANETTACPA